MSILRTGVSPYIDLCFQLCLANGSLTSPLQTGTQHSPSTITSSPSKESVLCYLIILRLLQQRFDKPVKCITRAMLYQDNRRATIVTCKPSRLARVANNDTRLRHCCLQPTTICMFLRLGPMQAHSIDRWPDRLCNINCVHAAATVLRSFRGSLFTYLFCAKNHDVISYVSAV